MKKTAQDREEQVREAVKEEQMRNTAKERNKRGRLRKERGTSEKDCPIERGTSEGG